MIGASDDIRRMSPAHPAQRHRHDQGGVVAARVVDTVDTVGIVGGSLSATPMLRGGWGRL